MKPICEEFRSGKILLDSLRQLAKSIESTCDIDSNDARYEYCSVAQNVVFFCQCTLADMIESEYADLRGTGALRLAISVADYTSTQKLLFNEIDEIRREQPEYEVEFLAGIRKMMDDRKLGAEWLSLVKGLEWR